MPTTTPPRAFILATCRNPDLFGATTLVFKSLRVGFPTARITVFDNANSELHRSELRELCRKNKTEFVHLPNRTIHHEWIEQLVTAAMADPDSEPFWLCDTDIMFWDSVEEFKFTAPLAGRLIPKFNCDFTQCETAARIHPSLLYIHPAKIGSAIDGWAFRHDSCDTDPLFAPKINLFHPVMLPHGTFFDTCALLYQLTGGFAFDKLILDRYDHLFCGTISDLVGPCLNDGKMQDRHADLIANPEKMRGIWMAQDEYYRQHATSF